MELTPKERIIHRLKGVPTDKIPISISFSIYGKKRETQMHRIIETKRLILKTLDKKDAPLVLDYLSRNREFLQKWEPGRSEGFYTEEFQGKELSREQSEMEAGQMLKLWIFRKGEDRIIGSLTFGSIVRGAFLSCFLGYRLDKDELNCGYITEALRTGIDLMFGEYGLHRIEANIMPRNKRSLRVVQKLGFHDEGCAKKYLSINGVWEDHIHMVLLNE
jgi:ribosomal-protein-alanine N-acetyltransferase